MASQITPVSTEQDVEAPPPPPPPSHDEQTKAKDLFAASAIETSSKGKDQESTKTLIPSNPPPIDVADEEADRRWTSTQYLRRRRCLLRFGGCCGAAVLLLGLLLLVLSFTVLKVKDPTLTINQIIVGNVNLGPGSTWAHPVSVNATLTLDMSLKNPNVASFAYGDSTTEFCYQGHTVGVGYAPGGKVGADRTVRMNATLDVMLDRIGQTDATENLVDGNALSLTSSTDIRGRVDVVGIYKRNIDVMLNCSMALELDSQTQSPVVRNQHCVANIR